MPPALSSHGSSSDDQSPPPKKGAASKAAPVEDEGDSDSEGSGAEDEYVVEKIISHKIVKGQLVFEVKWQGYEEEADRTWEPEDNMDGAIDVLNEYFEKIGGRPEPTKGKGQKRKSRPSEVKSAAATPVPATKTKRVKQEKTWSPPPGSWEHDVSHCDTVEERFDAQTGKPARYAYLVWNNRKKTQHPLSHTYQKCPQKMLQYYESHLVFTHNNDDPPNGDDMDMAS